MGRIYNYCTNLHLPRILLLMSVVLRNWARQVRSLSGFPHQRGPFVTPEMCPHFLLMSMTMSSTPKDAFAPVSESLHPGIPFLASFFRPKPSVSSHWGAETLLGYHSLISGSYRGSPLLERAFDDDDQRILLHQFNQLEGF